MSLLKQVFRGKDKDEEPTSPDNKRKSKKRNSTDNNRKSITIETPQWLQSTPPVIHYKLTQSRSEKELVKPWIKATKKKQKKLDDKSVVVNADEVSSIVNAIAHNWNKERQEYIDALKLYENYYKDHESVQLVSCGNGCICIVC
jgi:hypothetical protein